MKLTLPGKPYRTMLEAGLRDLQSQDVLERIWSRDHTLWKPEPDEITNRLGWLDIATRMEETLPGIKHVGEEIRREGIQDLYLLGMGGSSLAPELFSRTFPHREMGLKVIDSTHPAYLRSVLESLRPERSLFIVASKSGTTVETLSFFKTFYRTLAEHSAVQEPGKHFVAITDPGSHLVELAERYRFRSLFKNDPDIGGRYSVLSHFGLVPAGLLGLDLMRLLQEAQSMAEQCRTAPGESFNPGLELGNALGVFAVNGRDKVTFINPSGLASFPDWVEQLLAESTGKEGRGILPVVGTAPGQPEVYGSDRLFVHFSLEGDQSGAGQVQALRSSGYPIIEITLDDRYQLGGQFFLWEMAVAAAGVHLGINPFDQPNVESAKRRARAMMTTYRDTGSLPESRRSGPDPTGLDQFIRKHRQPESYLALQAYLPPQPEVHSALARLQHALRDRYQLAATLGFGPRYLHSTGQLHKGDSGNGIFIQLIDSPETDLPVPLEADADRSEFSFGTLIRAQALGDASALRDAGRPVLQIDPGKNLLSGINSLV